MTRRHRPHHAWGLAVIAAILGACSSAPPPPPPPPTPAGPEAAAGFDGKSNGLVSDSVHAADRTTFDQVEEIADGLGPVYNAQSCRECHQNPASGGGSQVTELRVGHLGPDGRFRNPDIAIGRGNDTIHGRTLVNDRAICPNATFPDSEIQERVPDEDTIQTRRASLNLLGDGLVEAVPDSTLIGIALAQRRATGGRIHGTALFVPIVESPGKTGVGRFGWKDQHASLLSFSGDAYVNEMGITNTLFPDEVTNVCNTVSEPNDTPGADGLQDIDKFARFVRATKAPARDSILAATAAALRGSALFDSIGCVTCHVRSMMTAAAGTVIDGGRDTVTGPLAGRVFHPFGDFLLHDVGTGDGIAIAVPEHYGRRYAENRWPNFSMDTILGARNKLRTPPLWGVRFRPRLMHDQASFTFHDAILRHRREAEDVTDRFRGLSATEQLAIIAFLKSL
ncbi:MAG TPA: di-heme oxidoredictase family protein [Gemmatimonadales bacterium]|nr:di-heme oxidoredictase family protein [Gemmatimonadales bacterium]